MALRGNGKKWEAKEIRQKGRKFVNKKLTLYKETKENYNDKEKTKQKGRKEKETQLMPGIKLRTLYAPSRFVTTTSHGNIL